MILSLSPPLSPQELSKRIATAARAPIVVGDVFQDEAAGELQLRYMASLDGAPLDKAARTHEKLRTLSELLAPFAAPESEEPVSQLTIEVRARVCCVLVRVCVFACVLCCVFFCIRIYRAKS